MWETARQLACMPVAKRIVIPEILDHLPADDPEAIRSRRDLRRVNLLMGNERWVCRTVRGFPEAAGRGIVEIGAGDGVLCGMLARSFPQARVTAYDLAPRPADLEARVEWRRGDIFAVPAPEPGGVLVATVPNFGYHAWRALAVLRAQVPAEPDRPKENRFNGVHIRFFSRLMFRRLFQSAGFDNVWVGNYGESSVWDVFQFGPPFCYLTSFARKRLPRPFHLEFMADVWPNVFAQRLRAVVYKPK